jgi:hypothetical protein
MSPLHPQKLTTKRNIGEHRPKSSNMRTCCRISPCLRTKLASRLHKTNG